MKARIPQGPSRSDMLRQVQKMQEDMANKQAELEEAEYEVAAGGGMVKVKINGKKEIVSLEINPDIVDPDDIEMMSDIIIAAVNEAIKTLEETNEREMQKITGSMGSMGLPGGLF